MWKLVPCTFLFVLAASCTGGHDRTSRDHDPLAGVISIETRANGVVHVISEPEGVWSHTGAEPWRLVEDLRIGVIEGDEHYMFGSARNVIPDANGRIWVLDSQANELRLYSQEGEFVRAVGRPGEGPGEFGSNTCAFGGPEGEIWVESRRRWQRFGPEGEFLGGQQTTRQLGCGIRSWLPDGRFIAVQAQFDPATREPVTSFLIHDRESTGEVIVTDTTPSPEVARPPTVSWLDGEGRARITDWIPLVHRANFVLGPNGDFWISDGGGDYRIRRLTVFGDTLVIMERPYDPILVPDSVRQAEMPEPQRGGLRLDRDFDPDDVPRVFPPFDRLLVGTDGHLWARRRVEGGAPSLDVFAPDGRYLGPVEAPPGFDRMTVLHVGPEHIYGVVRDEFEVQYVFRLSIQRPGS